MRQLLALGILFCMFHSVQARPFSETLSKDRMVGILADLELVRAMVYDYDNADKEEADQLFRENVQRVYQTHATEPVTFQKSYLYYLNHPRLMQEIYALVIARLEELLVRV